MDTRRTGPLTDQEILELNEIFADRLWKKMDTWGTGGIVLISRLLSKINELQDKIAQLTND